MIAFVVVALAVRIFFLINSPDRAPAFEEPTLVENGSGEPRGVRLGDSGIYFAPLGDFSTDMLESLGLQLNERWGIQPNLLDPITIEESAKPSGNRQLDAFNLVDQVHRAYVASVQPSVVIGFIANDVRAYATDDFWNFGAVSPEGYAVISTARMDPRSFGEPADEDLLMERLRKMTTRYIALTYFDLRYSDDPRSVLYTPIRSRSDLDQMTEWPCPDRPREMIAC